MTRILLRMEGSLTRSKRRRKSVISGKFLQEDARSMRVPAVDSAKAGNDRTTLG